MSCALVADNSSPLSVQLDAAARRDDTAAVLLHLGSLTDHEALARVASAASRHLPIVAVVAPTGGEDPWRERWLGSVGALVAPTLAAAAERASALRGLDPTEAMSCAVVASDDEAAAAALHSLGVCGLSATRGSGDIASVVGSLRVDLVVAVIGSATELEGLVRARRAHPEVGVLAVLDVDDAEQAAATLAPLGVPALPATVAVGEVVAALELWGEVVRGRSQLRAGGSDAGRLRRAVRGLRRPAAESVAPEQQSEWVAALGLPYARTARCAYLEDAPLVAAEVGYPVRVMPVHQSEAATEATRWEDVSTAEALLGVAESQLAAVARRFGRGAQLVVASTDPSAQVVSVRAERVDGYGVGLTLSGARADDVLRFVAPVDERQLAAALAATGRSASHSPIAATLSALTSALRTLPEVAAISVELELSGGNFTCRHVRLRPAPGALEAT